MEVAFHPLVKRDLMEDYKEISTGLAGEFEEEVRFVLSQAIVNPLRFHLVDQGFRRANLRRFPYHMLYELRVDMLRVMHIRHNRRHPDYGRQRQ